MSVPVGVEFEVVTGVEVEFEVATGVEVEAQVETEVEIEFEVETGVEVEAEFGVEVEIEVVQQGYSAEVFLEACSKSQRQALLVNLDWCSRLV